MLEKLQELMGFHPGLTLFDLKSSLIRRRKKCFALSAVIHVYSQLANKIRFSMHLTVNCVCALRSH